MPILLSKLLLLPFADTMYLQAINVLFLIAAVFIIPAALVVWGKFLQKVILGIKISAAENMIMHTPFQKIKTLIGRFIKTKNLPAIFKPLIDCPICMASLYSMLLILLFIQCIYTFLLCKMSIPAVEWLNMALLGAFAIRILIPFVLFAAVCTSTLLAISNTTAAEMSLGINIYTDIYAYVTPIIVLLPLFIAYVSQNVAYDWYVLQYQGIFLAVSNIDLADNTEKEKNATPQKEDISNESESHEATLTDKISQNISDLSQGIESLSAKIQETRAINASIEQEEKEMLTAIMEKQKARMKALIDALIELKNQLKL